MRQIKKGALHQSARTREDTTPWGRLTGSRVVLDRPDPRRAPGLPRVLGWLALAAALAVPIAASADREHVVREGQSLARIAQRYDVSVRQLAAANRLSSAARLRAGQVLTVPSKGVVYVDEGDTLAEVARDHEIPVTALARHNGLRPDAPLRVGQRLTLPGQQAAAEDDAAAQRWGTPKSPGVATLIRLWSKERRRVRLVDRSGHVSAAAVRELRHLLRPRDSRQRRHPAPRLLQLLARVSDHFGGRSIQIVSGLRLPGGTTKESSRHVQGHAIDFRIVGVPLDALHDYCARFDAVGVGLYPRSRFVHLDVRERNARWTDWSGPGEAQAQTTPGADADAADH